ncbi:MAG: hypothetical protein JWO73_106 [Candidatus Taylorbacteria bacterium]|nr:hypothetical protein [Candidatus Taylorbacteria bacterium]
MNKYIQIAQQITNLNWSGLSVADLQALLILSAYAADEFAESLRLARALYPESKGFEDMAAGELQTGNLKFGDYSKVDDHSEFLWFFDTMYFGENTVSKEVRESGGVYMRKVRTMTPPLRAMSVISRLREFSGMPALILKAPGWCGTAELLAFRYYLEKHAALDSGQWNHAEMFSGFQVDDSVAPFYEARLDMYRVIPRLFEKNPA